MYEEIIHRYNEQKSNLDKVDKKMAQVKRTLGIYDEEDDWVGKESNGIVNRALVITSILLVLFITLTIMVITLSDNNDEYPEPRIQKVEMVPYPIIINRTIEKQPMIRNYIIEKEVIIMDNKTSIK